MKQSKTTIKELQKRYRAVLLKCALINAALLTVCPSVHATGFTITDNDTATYTRVPGEGISRYNLVINGEQQELSFSDSLTMTGGSLIINSAPIKTWLDWQGNGDITISGGIVSAENGEHFSGYRSDLSISGTADIRTALSSESNVTISGGTITLSGVQIPEEGLYFTEAIGVLPAEPDETTGVLTVSGGNITLNQNRQLAVVREWNNENPNPVSYDGNINISGGTITLNGNAQIIRTDIDHSTSEGAYLKNSNPEELSKTTGEINISGGTVNLNDTAKIINHSNDGTIAISGTAVVNVNGTNTFENSTGTATATLSGGTLDIKGALTANIDATSGTLKFSSNNAVLNGALSGEVNLRFNDNYAYSNINAANATVGTVTIANGKTLDIGEGRITATTITGGTLKATLTDAATENPIIQATADNVTLSLDMSKASRDEVTLYHITALNEAGFTFGQYSLNRYAVSDEEFSIDDAKTIGTLSDTWQGGDLYILRLATAGEAVVEDLIDQGIPVSGNEQNAIAALDDEVIEKLAPAQKAVAQRINALLETAAASGNTAQMKQILREIAPEAAPSASSTATSNAGAVMNVVGGRMGGGSPAPSTGSGRSGGDYTAGALSAWAQMMYNKADLHKADGFDADSTGFAAGLEYAINEDVKAGFGYAFTDTEIDTARSKTDVDTHTVFAYGEYKPDAFYVNGVLSYGHSKYDEKTKLAGLQTDYHANTFAGQLMSGYTFGDFTPEAGLRYTSVRQRSYTNALGARMASQTLDTWTWVAGVKAAKSFRAGDTVVTPDAKLALTYDFRRDGQARTVTLANGSSYVADGENMKRFGVEFGAGVTVKVGGNTDVGLSYEGKFKDHYTDHTILFNAKYNF